MTRRRSEFWDSRSLSRRQALARALALPVIAGSLPQIVAADGTPAPSPLNGIGASGFGRAKRCLFLFMWGGPSHLDTWDMKPNAPDEVRGEFKPIATNVPGTLVSEHFPRLAQWADRYAIVRSLTHDDPAHLSSAHHLLTGHYAPKRFSDADPPSPNDWPHLGSAISKLRPNDGRLPTFVTLPWTVMHPAAPGGRAPGQHGGWLGPRFDAMGVGDPNDPAFAVPGVALPPDVNAERMARRRQLLSHLDAGPTSSWDELTARAMGFVEGSAARQAFDLSLEPDAVRDRYGRTTHGQSVLLARRLIEAGVTMVTVNWHNDGQNFWDTHGQNFKQLRERLMPDADQAFSALLSDLSERGLLEDTIVTWVGEFGRRPHITKENAGREHWPRCFSGVFAGGGIQGGRVYGASDAIGAYPADKPVSPSDWQATICHALGIGPEVQIYDRQAVPKSVVAGQPLLDLFA